PHWRFAKKDLKDTMELLQAEGLLQHLERLKPFKRCWARGLQAHEDYGNRDSNPPEVSKRGDGRVLSGSRVDDDDRVLASLGRSKLRIRADLDLERRISTAKALIEDFPEQFVLIRDQD